MSGLSKGKKLPQLVPSELSVTAPRAGLCGFDAPAAVLPITPHSPAEAVASTRQYLPERAGWFPGSTLQAE